MFGPNKSNSLSHVIDFHHREPKFFELYHSVVELFKAKFNVPDNFDVLLLTGSGTLAIESFVYSFDKELKLMGEEGEFKSRWKKLLENYNKLSEDSGHVFYSHLETSISHLNEIEDPFFVDAVSSFPYYDIPSGAKIWVTVSSKLLGASPVLGIIVVDKGLLDELRGPKDFTYLNINRIREFNANQQTPHTPSIGLIMDLYEKLVHLNTDDLRNEVNGNCDSLINAIGEEKIVGEKYCPVLTIPKELFPEAIASKYNLYGYHTQSKNIQIFTYSEERHLYEALSKDIEQSTK